MAINLGRNLGRLVVASRVYSIGSGASRPVIRRVPGARQYHEFLQTEYLGGSAVSWVLWPFGASCAAVWIYNHNSWKVEKELEEKLEKLTSVYKKKAESLTPEVEHYTKENIDLKETLADLEKSLANMRNGRKA